MILSETADSNSLGDLLQILQEVRDNYDCVHRLGATDLASQAYQEYIRLSNVLPENGDLTALSPEDNQQLTADFRAVIEVGQYFFALNINL